jgi:transcriptional regulator with XRE-family HTH domain
MKVLQNYRLSNNLTQEQFAEKSGIPLSDIKMLESATGDPRLDLLKRLADSMEMELRIIFAPIDM